MSNPLYQKHHGMPGIGVQGKHGNIGEKGQGIYIGFINTFFETNDIPVNTIVKIAQRKISNYERETEYDAYAESRHAKYNQAVEDSSDLFSYIRNDASFFKDEADSLYYSGRLSDNTLADDGYNAKYDIMDNKINSENYFKSDGLTSRQEPVERWVFNQIYNIIKGDKNYIQLYEYAKDEDGQYTTEPKYDVQISVDTMTYEPQDIVKIFGGYESYNKPLYQNIADSSIWFTFLRYFSTASSQRSTIWYTNLTTGSSSDTSLMFEKLAFNLDSDYLLDNNKDVTSSNITEVLGPEYSFSLEDDSYLNAASYSMGVDSHFTVVNNGTTPRPGNITYSYNADLKSLPYITAASRAKVNKKIYIKYDGSKIKDYLLTQYVHVTANTLPPIGLPDIFVDDNNLTQIALDVYDPSIYSTIVLNSSNNYEFDRPALYNILQEKDKYELRSEESLKDFANNYRHVAEDFLQKYEIVINHYKNHGASLPDSSVRWSSNNYEKISLPTTLSETFKPGDILYFYTDEKQFALDNKIKYMITLTEDMLNCDINTLLKNAKIIDPFEYQTLFIKNNRIEIYNNINILKNNNYIYYDASSAMIENYYMKSIGNIISDNQDVQMLIGAKPIENTFNYFNIDVINKNNTASLKCQSYLGYFQKDNGIYNVDINAYETDTDYKNSLDGSIAETFISDKQMIYEINVNNAILKLNNVYIPKDILLTNMEAYDVIYDSNIIYMNDYCLYSLSSEDVIVKVNFGDLFEKDILNTFNTYAFVLNKKNYVKEQQYFKDYQLGYYVYVDGNVLYNDLLDFDVNQYVIELDPIKDTNILTTQQEGLTTIEYQILVYIHKVNSFNIFAKCTNLTCNIKLESVNGNYKLTQPDYKVIIDGENVQTEVYNEFIKFTLSGISVNKGQVLLDISTNDENIYIDSVYFNSEDLNVNKFSWSWAAKEVESINSQYDAGNMSEAERNNAINNIYEEVKKRLTRNISWVTMIPDAESILNNEAHKIFTLDVSDNIPDITYIDTNNKEVTHFISDFMVTFDDNATNTIANDDDYRSMFFDMTTDDMIQCELFNRIMSNMPISMAASRYLNIAVKYHVLDDENVTDNGSYPSYYENYIITQPGFTDPRNIPSVELTMYNKITEVEQFNKVEQGILCNQIQSFMKIDINDFNYDSWGKYIDNLDDTTLELEITNIQNDLEWTDDLTITQKATRATIKLLLDDQNILKDEDKISLNNCIKFTVRGFMLPDNKTIYDVTQAEIDDYVEDFANKCDITVTPLLMQSNIGVEISEDNMHEGYIILNEDICMGFVNPQNIYSGIFENVNIHLSGLTIEDTQKPIYINFMFEMGNPMIANLYLRFAVTKLSVHYKDVNGVDHKFSTYSDNNNINDTYLHQIEDNKEYYTFISEKFDMMIHPISMIACPQEIDEELPYMSGAVKKIGSEDEIKLSMKFYGDGLYKSDILNINKATQRTNMLYSWDGMLLKKKHLQDNTKYISVNTMTLSDTINKFSKNYIFKNSNYENILSQSKAYEPINNMNYLAVTYHSNILNPKLRDDERSFIYNEKAYLESKYDQFNKKCPVFIQEEHNWELRSDDLMDAIDTWNFEYQSQDSLSTADKVFSGVINTYGNGYNYLPDAIDTGLYDRNGILSLYETKEQNNETIYDKIEYFNIGTPTPISINTPSSKKFFRTPLYHLSWEYQVYNGSNIIPFPIISLFDFVAIHKYANNKIDEYWEELGARNLQQYDILRSMPYNLVYKISPRIAYNDDTNTLNCFMLRRPAIGDDNDIKETCVQNCYKLNNRLYNLTDGINNMPNSYQIP